MGGERKLRDAEPKFGLKRPRHAASIVLLKVQNGRYVECARRIREATE
jgi:hypothetical protein